MLKRYIRKIHLWLGIITGPIVFVVALTGCIYSFQEEIQDLTQPFRFVNPSAREMLPPSRIREIADSVTGNNHLHAIMYHGKDRAVKAIYYSFDEYYDFVYINPYSGKVLENYDVSGSFFGFILSGHFYLWLPPAIGQPLVATSVLIFFFILISGIYLWWPRNKSNKRQKFSIKWNARWRRKNYDLHSVIGFYVAWMAIILTFTGLIWGFTWFRDAVYSLASGGNEFVEYADPGSDLPDSNTFTGNALDEVWELMKADYPNADWIEIHPPETVESSIAANANPDASTYWKTDYRYFDQYTLKELSVEHQWGRYMDASNAEKFMRMNYDIHVGGILGFGGKIIAFLISLIIASLPITGFLIWYGRRKKEKAADVVRIPG